jgi:hypothetical protein
MRHCCRISKRFDSKLECVIDWQPHKDIALLITYYHMDDSFNLILFDRLEFDFIYSTQFLFLFTTLLLRKCVRIYFIYNAFFLRDIDTIKKKDGEEKNYFSLNVIIIKSFYLFTYIFLFFFFLNRSLLRRVYEKVVKDSRQDQESVKRSIDSFTLFTFFHSTHSCCFFRRCERNEIQHN